jgi:ferredoxin-nitrite reductase
MSDMGQDFSAEQKRFLEGFTSGLQIARAAGAVAVGGVPLPAAPAAPSGPDAAHLAAMARTEGEGKKLVDQEKWKRSEHPFDAYERFRKQARSGAYPKPDDNFRWRFHGLFYVAPNQDSYMCRLRLPNGILTGWQMKGAADIAEKRGGGYAHVTTRANLQIREIKAADAPDTLEELARLGLATKGSGADNIRNVTGSATAGVDAQELLDTRPLANDWHFHILNDRSLYGLPRKFNVGFDGGGVVATLEDTNDIGFQAVRVRDGAGAAPGVWCRLALGGITGHKDMARDTGVVVAPDQTTAVADAVVRVFIDRGDRTNRAKARLKYVLDAMGFDAFLAAVEEKLGSKLARVDASFVEPRPQVDRLAHIGVRGQRQKGLNWIGVWTPLGKMTAAQMRAIGDVANALGDGDIRLTVWQNLLITGVADANVARAKELIAAAGLSTEVSNVRAGLVACTGNKGCKFAAADTKGTALAIADHMDARLALDTPVNIHLTGCHHSCAQHYVGDIGLLAAKVTINAEGDQVEGYHLCVGGGFAEKGKIGRQIQDDIKADDAPKRVEAYLRAYMKHRAGPDEAFHGFANRLDDETLSKLAAEELA